MAEAPGTPASVATPPLTGLTQGGNVTALNPALIGSDESAAAASLTTMLSTSAIVQQHNAARRRSLGGSLPPHATCAPTPVKPATTPQVASLRNLAASFDPSSLPGVAATPPHMGRDSGLHSDLRRICGGASVGSTSEHREDFCPGMSPMQASVRSNPTPLPAGDVGAPVLAVATPPGPRGVPPPASGLPATAVADGAAASFRRHTSDRNKRSVVAAHRQALAHGSPHAYHGSADSPAGPLSGLTTPATTPTPTRAAAVAATAFAAEAADAHTTDVAAPTHLAVPAAAHVGDDSDASPVGLNSTVAGAPPDWARSSPSPSSPGVA